MRKYSSMIVAVMVLCLVGIGILLSCPTTKQPNPENQTVAIGDTATCTIKVDWSADEDTEWDDNHTIKMEYKPEGGNWQAGGTVSLNPS